MTLPAQSDHDATGKQPANQIIDNNKQERADDRLGINRPIPLQVGDSAKDRLTAAPFADSGVFLDIFRIAPPETQFRWTRQASKPSVELGV